MSSDLFDHTSVLRFLETRFGAEVPNLSAWRRATVGDLTSALNFKKPDQSIPNLPSTVEAIPQAIEQCVANLAGTIAYNVVSLSMTFIEPSHLGQRQRTVDSLVEEASCPDDWGFWAAPEIAAHDQFRETSEWCRRHRCRSASGQPFGWIADMAGKKGTTL